VQVVHAHEHRSEHFTAAVEVVQVGAREPRAGGAGAARVERLLVGLVAGVANPQVAEAREQVAVAGVSRRHHAVEHVDAGGDAIEQVLGRADAHQVARLGCGQAVRRMGDDPLHRLLRLADADAADRIAR